MASVGGMHAIVDALVGSVEPLTFAPPVTFIYNPLVYARRSYNDYCRLYAAGPKEVILLGMNPGPWGMVQTGIPFGDARMVSEWLALKGSIDAPIRQHPMRAIQGFACSRREVSGQRLWGWAQRRFGTPRRFFKRFWVANYCPLAFLEESGRNRTPDKLPKDERQPLFAACDQALKAIVDLLKPVYVIGIGKFARERATSALEGLDLKIGGITHPSPANPKANQGWEELVETELAAAGIRL
jgi:single-strand selective monofunctional uracil DNA glycosylase